MRDRIIDILETMKADSLERDEPLALSLLSALAGENIFLLGLPGVGKSMIARKLKLAFKDAKVFEYLMSRFSTPDEIFGPVSISKLKDDDCYERIVAGYLPDAEVVFLDEIWKAGPAIQNSLLTVLNEKIYLNGNNELALPLKGVIAASNELPARDEGLEALWDRFLVRYVVNPIESKSNFFQLLNNVSSETKLHFSSPLNNDEYLEIRNKSRLVSLPEIVLEIIYAVRSRLYDKANGKVEEDESDSQRYYVSDRRWKKAVGLLRTSAYLNGRKEVDLSDVLLLCHVLWNEDSTRQEIAHIVAETVIVTLFNEILVQYKNYKRITKEKAVDPRLYTPDRKHYIVKCDDAPLKLRISDYEQMRKKPNQVYFAAESEDGTIVIRNRGQFIIRYVKEGCVCINNYNYMLRTNADSRLNERFLSETSDSMDEMENSMYRCMNDNIFISSSLIYSNVREVIRVYKERLKIM